MGTTYTIDLAGNLTARALDGAKAIDKLTTALAAEQKTMASTTTAIARMQAGGKVDLGLVAKAREGTTRIEALKQQIAAARAQGERPTKLGFIDAIERSGGPIGGLIKNIKAAWGALKDNPSAAVAVSLAALSAVVVSVGSKLLGLARDAITLGVGFADAARSSRLLNEAADIAGGTHKQLSGIIEDVRRRSDVARDRLAEMGRSLRIIGFDSRQTQLTLRGMAIAESALGSEASGALKSIAEQSRAFRRLTLGARDAYGEYASLRSIGLRKADLFAELARGTGRSVAEVRSMVSAGRVSVRDGMAAIEAALQRKFGGTVRAQAMSISSQFRRMSEDFSALFSGADIEPLLAGLKSITSIFSADTASGVAFKKVVTGLLNDLGKTAESLGPVIKEALLGLAAEAAQPGGLAATFRGWIQDAKDLGKTIKEVAEAIKDIAAAAKTIGGVVKDIGIVKAPIESAGKNVGIDNEAARKASAAFAATEMGEKLTAGIRDGINRTKGEPISAITGLAAEMNAAWKKANMIQSPSRLYEKDATYIPAGAAKGVRRNTSVAVEAVVDMSDAMSGGFKAPAAGSIGGNTYNIKIDVDARGSGADEIARAVRIEVFSVIKSAVDRGPQPSPG